MRTTKINVQDRDIIKIQFSDTRMVFDMIIENDKIKIHKIANRLTDEFKIQPISANVIIIE